MNKRTKIITGIALTTTLAIGAVGAAGAYGKHRFGSPEARAERAVEYITEELKLEANQVQSLELLRNQLLSSAQLVRSEMSPLRSEITALVAADSFDQARALELVNAKANAMTATAPDVISATGSFLDGLNTEQKAEILEFMEKHESRHRGRHGHKRGE